MAWAPCSDIRIEINNTMCHYAIFFRISCEICQERAHLCYTSERIFQKYKLEPSYCKMNETTLFAIT